MKPKTNKYKQKNTYDRISRKRHLNNCFKHILYTQEGRKQHKHIKERHGRYKIGPN